MKLFARAVLAASLLGVIALAQASSLAIVVQDGAGKPLADTVVYAEQDGLVLPKGPKGATIEQRGLKFLPLVTVVQSGAAISFPNNDKVRHHIYSFSPAKKFDQKLYSGVAASSQLFDKAGTVVLGCNIHDRMIAYVKVVDTPYFARTDSDGVAHIELPAGKYKLSAWHFNQLASAGADQQVTVKGGDGATAASFKLALKAATDGEGSGY
ncbi:methylamine utilization protein [Massilia sp. PWRC2]|uniref:methylamine utilization protein n=1 Tax=Massilia sp. PWRC2 TaxID=2804626 RepID=UPI003CF8ABBC